ncbi:MAG: non-canonical purine NTP pyrophosphatase [Chloroflexota bacterium]
MLYYVTSNDFKFSGAVKRVKNYGIELTQARLALEEIQSYSIEEIATKKAIFAFDQLKKPLLVSDIGWNILALGGFPGAFMSYIDSWLSTENFLKLMEGLEDRRIILTQVIVYKDKHQSKVFEHTIQGVILEEGGETDYKSIDPIVSFRSDKKSLTQARIEEIPTRTRRSNHGHE